MGSGNGEAEGGGLRTGGGGMGLRFGARGRQKDSTLTYTRNF